MAASFVCLRSHAMSQPFVAILMGSDSDLPVMQACSEVLTGFGLRWEMKVSSAHRTPDATRAYVADAESRGCAVFICAAGMAAHLAGAVAAHTQRPVIGVPIESSLDGLDALLSTVQMPAGIPVATVAIGKAGAKNAAYLAAQILGVADAGIHRKVKDERAAQTRAVLEKDAALQAKLQA